MEGEKNRVRAIALSQRRSLSSAEFQLYSRSIQDRVLGFEPYLNSSSVVLYSPIQNEVATEIVRDHALREGKRLFYPRSSDQEQVDLIQIHSRDELRPGRFGILQPVGSQRLSDCCDELVAFVPGVAFDLEGNRLGRGGGWYDRMIAKLSHRGLLVGLAYEFQLVEKVPTEAWDRKVHFIITERRVVSCGNVPLQSSFVKFGH